MLVISLLKILEKMASDRVQSASPLTGDSFRCKENIFSLFPYIFYILVARTLLQLPLVVSA